MLLSVLVEVAGVEGPSSSRVSETISGASCTGSVGRTCPGGGPANITSPPWSHSNSQSAETVTSAAMKGLRSAVYRIGAVDVSPDGGFLHRSVFGGAARVNDPIHSGTASSGMLRGVNEELAGGMACRTRESWRVADLEQCRVVGG